MQKAALHHGVQDLPLTREIAMAAVALPEIHNDPFDRILVAEASTTDAASSPKTKRSFVIPA